MKLKIIENSSIPSFFGANGITLYPFVFLDRPFKQAKEDQLLGHEYVHVLQIRQMGVVKFYFNYLKEFAINLSKYRNFDKAYHNISFEIEAYTYQGIVFLPDPLE